MRTNSDRGRLPFLACALAVLLSLPVLTVAQDEPPPRPLVDTTVVSPLGERLTILQENGSPANRIKLLITADCYTAKMKEDHLFKRQRDAVIRDLFSCEPFKSYRSFFNIYSFYTSSGDPQPANPNVARTYQTRFGTVQQGKDLLVANYSELWKSARLFLDPDFIIVIVNNGRGGGEARRQNVVLLGTQNALTAAAYFVGMNLGELAPEWADDESEKEHPGALIAEPPYPNVTIQTDPDQCKWRAWFPPDTVVRVNSSPGVGLWEGAYFRRRGVFRPAAFCRMRDFTGDFCPVCVEVLVLRFHERVHMIEAVDPPDPLGDARIDVASPGLTFSVRTPWAGGLRFGSRWSFDGVEQPRSRDSDRFSVVPQESLVGPHELSVQVYDDTPFVRTDPSGLCAQTHVWRLNVLPPAPRAKRGSPRTAASRPAGSSGDAPAQEHP
ncbi:MAG: M64 family metallopeptidase [Planctomycetota bacterium]